MGITFTPDQKKVIELHNRNILVSAAAGSGKTAVLVERIIRMVCDESHPVDIDRLLIVTFTNAAAAEMRERISQGIARQLQLHPESEHIERQGTLLHNALITTIDSFCLYLIRNHFHEIGLDPAFRVADEGEIRLLRQDVLAQQLEDCFAQKDQAFLDCVEYFCPGGRERVLENMIQEIHTFAMSYPWPEQWLEERKKDCYVKDAEELEQSNIGSYILQYLEKMLDGCASVLKQAQCLCQEPDGPYMYGTLIDRELDALEKIIRTGREYHSLSRWEQDIYSLSFERLPVKKDSSVSSEKREMAKNLRNTVKETIKELQNTFFAKPLEAYVRQLQESAPYVETLVELTLDFGRRLAKKKQEKKILDFSDMEHFALNILIKREGDMLQPSPVALDYREHFVEILIDEYQDSNLVQEYLLRAVSGEESGHFNRFMVGDVKQSIYKFRLARPELFQEKYESYNMDEGNCQRIDLSKNFRSRREVLDTVNHIFSRIMSREKGGIAYDDKAALYVGASYPENLIAHDRDGELDVSAIRFACKSELFLVEKPQKGDDWNAKQAEGHAIARRIKELRAGFQVTDKATGKLRPVQYRDIVILLRTNSGWDEELKTALQEEGIPVSITSKTGYFAAREVQEILQFLRVLDNPCQDIPLYGVMKSVFGGFTEEEIAQLRSTGKKGYLWDCVCGADNEKCITFREQIEKYRRYTVYMPIRELLQHIVEDHSYLHYVTAMPAGSKRRANVEMLFTKAEAFEKTSYYGLFHFVRYIEQLEKYDVDFGEAELVDENSDLVRIMSIHKSKGLEFPVTFVAGMAKRFNMQDTNKEFLMDVDMGIGADYVNLKQRTRDITFRKAVLSKKMKEDNLAEELRVLYVALTRAKEKLIMTATIPNAAERMVQEWGREPEGLTFMEYMGSGSYLDLVLPVLSEEVVDVRIFEDSDFYRQEMEEQLDMEIRYQQLTVAGEYADREVVETLLDRFRYQYQYENLTGLYTKTTVSELKLAAMADKDEAAFHTFEEQEIVPYIPGFRREQEAVTGADRGNAYHKVMELLDFHRLYDGVFENPSEIDGEHLKNGSQSLENGSQSLENGIQLSENRSIFFETGSMLLDQEKVRKLQYNLEGFLDHLVENGSLSEAYRKAINVRKCLCFLTDPIALRMWNAEKRGQLYREQPFVLGIPAKKLKESFPEEEKVLIQGIVDAFFVEEDGIVLLDYKTDKVSSGEELWNRYETQLEYYEEALRKLMNIPVKEKVLYSFGLEECIGKKKTV